MSNMSLPNIENVSKWLYLCDKITYSLNKIAELKKAREENTGFFDEYKTGIIGKDTKIYTSLGKHFVKMKPQDTYKYGENIQAKLKKDLINEQKILDKLMLNLLNMNPEYDYLPQDILNYIEEYYNNE